MSALVEQLKREHVALVEVLNQVKSLGIGTKEGKEKMLAARAGFVAHLKKEDVELYPVLWRAAESDSRLKHTLEMFASDMNKISKDILAFFSKYTYGGSDMEFARDFGSLFATLGARTRREESIIYAEYDKLQ